MREIVPSSAPAIRAYKLASVIHGDAAVAKFIARTALERLAGAVSAQDKRIYYGAQQSSARATKVWLDEEHILQQLVFAVSDRVERAEESRRPLQGNEVLVRFLKHLVWISTRRNLFYVTIAVARVLYGFTTPQTAEIYQSLIDDPDDAKDDAYYRARKRVLVDELSERFPDVVTSTRPDPAALSLAERCLEAFAPWGVQCDEGRDDLGRMHVLLHPRCFRERVASLGLAAPPRLRIPLNRVFADASTSSPALISADRPVSRAALSDAAAG